MKKMMEHRAIVYYSIGLLIIMATWFLLGASVEQHFHFIKFIIP